MKNKNINDDLKNLAMDQPEVPEKGRFCFFSPAAFGAGRRVCAGRAHAFSGNGSFFYRKE